jgi:hypothetical protein
MTMYCIPLYKVNIQYFMLCLTFFLVGRLYWQPFGTLLPSKLRISHVLLHILSYVLWSEHP